MVAGKVAAATELEAVAVGAFDDEHPPSVVAVTIAARTAKDQNRVLTSAPPVGRRAAPVDRRR